MIKIGERLKQLREALHLSQSYVADRVGVSRSAIVKMEQGQRKVYHEELRRLSELYGVTSDYILQGDEDINAEAEYFARSYQQLTEADREEIMNIIKFKKRLRKRLEEDK